MNITIGFVEGLIAGLIAGALLLIPILAWFFIDEPDSSRPTDSD